jgi:hypothetical protein
MSLRQLEKPERSLELSPFAGLSHVELAPQPIKPNKSNRLPQIPKQKTNQKTKETLKDMASKTKKYRPVHVGRPTYQPHHEGKWNHFDT